MKSLAYTLVVLMGALTVAQAASEKTTVPQEEVVTTEKVTVEDGSAPEAATSEAATPEAVAPEAKN